MPMDYDLLPDNYDADTVAAAMAARQVEHYHFALDAANFENILAGDVALLAATIEGVPGVATYGELIAKRLDETRARMAEVEGIYTALQAQIKDQAAHAAAVERLKAKRAAAEQPSA